MSDTWRPLAFGYDPQNAPDTCECGDSGYLLHQEYGFSWPRDVYRGEEAIPVQRCDQCRRFETDEEAAEAALQAEFDGVGFVVLGDPVIDSCDCEHCALDREELEDRRPPLDYFVIH